MYYIGDTMKVVTFRIEKEILEKMNELVERGYFKDKSELIRYAVRRLLEEWHY